MIAELLQGEHQVGPSTTHAWRSGAYREGIVGMVGLGQFFEAARNGRMFSLATAVGATLNGNASPLGAAGTPVWAIYNPVGNLKAAVILKASAMLIPAASAAPIIPVWEYRTNLTGLTAAGGSAALNTNFGSGIGSTMKTFVASALTGAAVASTFLRAWEGNFNDPRHAGTTSETAGGVATEETDGRIIVTPGTLLNVAFNVAGTAVTGSISVTWAEVDWPLQ